MLTPIVPRTIVPRTIDTSRIVAQPLASYPSDAFADFK
jgi:hypothetical protein